LDRESNHFHDVPVSHDPSRKHFLAKLIGLFAVASIAPRIFGQRAPVETKAPVASGVTIRNDSRAVARRSEHA
jgi:hypothetical protein